ncbi:murein DD-endopeptidase MepM/ murein hydrolase activator NlpD [Clostridium algifaecis]|uniref:Murein DD-endopeptidase MepM/ murein hydrolase activator NlpD n=1 Tax=Clostridium algifaecis TaxID=1472040 RepID=A0ABS4KQU1_9CLOT|nr:M23 family metallopeptidase [Clostridium algifaecis]MBP2032398.1 murein DD-endopeptidase MepM/ murein hydrolase activator NlpD [Clostridium algifaecis]
MDKKFIKGPINFFKKEGFYVILFICLCVAAAAAILTVKNNKNEISNENKAAISQKSGNGETAKAEKKYDNALQVKKDSNTQNKTNNSVQKQEPSKGVSNLVSTAFQKPVEGNIARAFSENPVYWSSTNTYRPNLGYDIQASVGKSVFAAMDGKVEEINTDTQDGVQVIINHQNGLKTVYSNLDRNLKVSKGQNVTKGTVIGSVGNTTLRSAYEKYGDHLHFAVLKGDKFVDPGKYIKY